MSKRRGQGHIYRPKYRDRHGELREARTWWIKYSIRGQTYYESSKSKVKSEAIDLLNRRLTERGQIRRPRDLEKIFWEDCRDLIVVDYQNQGNRTLRDVRGRLKHLDNAFTGWPMMAITEDAIDNLKNELLTRLSPATVNRVLAVLHRVFKLAQRACMVDRVPSIERCKERNVRTGFVETDDLAAIAKELPDDTAPIAWAGFYTGWRTGELLSRRFRHLDLEAGWLYLEPGETKNAEGRQFPIDVIPELRQLLEAQYEKKQEIERRTGRIVDAVFMRATGDRIRDFRGAWATACSAAGRPDTLFHDLRRSAVRNLVRAGIPHLIAMQLTGHRTASVFKRYAIVDETMLKEAGAKLAAYLKTTTGKSTGRKVIPIDPGRRE